MAERQTRVFISYSRADAAAIEELLKGLELAGFDAVFDREDILGGEVWKTRLMAMVAECDIFCPIVSPDWIASETCLWEAEQARAQAKRILPILIAPPGDVPPPDWISALNYVRCDEDISDADKFLRLAAALRTDVDWYRASSALLSRAQSWRGGAEGIILRGDEIREAQTLLNERPPGAPEPTALQLEFLAASEAAEHVRRDEELQKIEKERSLLARVRLGMAVFALALLAGGLFIWQQGRDLRVAELRLGEGLGLTIAKTERQVFSDPSWTRLVTDHKLAVAIISLDERSIPLGSGFLVPGGVFTSDWKDKDVLLTAWHVLSLDGRNSLKDNTRRMRAVFPAHKTDTTYRFVEVLAWDAKLDFALVELAEQMPGFATTIWPDDIEAVASPPPRGGGGIGILQWNHERDFTLGIGHRLDVQMRGLPEGMIAYTNMTAGGASGAPTFDMDTGDLLCLNQVAGKVPGSQIEIAGCMPIRAILNDVQRQWQ